MRRSAKRWEIATWILLGLFGLGVLLWLRGDEDSGAKIEGHDVVRSGSAIAPSGAPDAADGSTSVPRIAVVPDVASEAPAPTDAESRSDAEWGDAIDVRVTVVEELTEAAVQGAYLVQSRRADEDLSDDRAPAVYAVRTDERGEAIVRVRGAARYVAAIAVGVGASPYVWLQREPRVRIEISKFDARVAGLVVDHTGRGIEGAEVRLVERRPASSPNEDGATPKNVQRTTTSASDGSFAFRASSSWARCTVRALHRGSVSNGLSITPGDTAATQLRIEMPGRFVVKGRLEDWRGQPVSNGTVMAHGPVTPEFPQGESASVRSDAVGGFEIALRTQGRFRVVSPSGPESPGGEPVQVNVDAASTAVLTLRLDEPCSQSVRVVGQRPDEVLRIVATPSEEGSGQSSIYVRDIEVRGDGVHVLENLRRGVAYEVMLLTQGEKIAQTRVVAGVDATIELKVEPTHGTCVLSCRVVEAAAAADRRASRLSVRALGGIGATYQRSLAETEIEPGVAVELRELPAVDVVVLALTEHGTELARSRPMTLGEQPSSLTIEVPAVGRAELTVSAIAEGELVFARILWPDGTALVQQGSRRMQAAMPATWELAAGSYTMRVTREVGGKRRVEDLPCVVRAADVARLRL